jgi:hypothetical protein
MVSMRRAHAPSIGLLATLAAALPACDGCHAGKPYTPYTLTDPPSTSSSAHPTGSAAPGDAGAETPAFAPVTAAPAPGDGKSWPLEGGEVPVPAGHVFTEGLVFDADDDGKPDLVAWARAPDGLHGQLWFAPGSKPDGGRAVASLPAEAASSGCNATRKLSRIGPRAVVFDLDPRCPARGRDRAFHWVAVLRLPPGGAPPEVGLELRLGAPADGETLALTVDGRDRDGDGRGDLTATLTLSGAPHPFPAGASASATLAFFDRPAGLSRDPLEPEASLKALVAGLVADGRRKTTAPRIGPAALAARRLHALLCEEAGKPAVTTSAGPSRCAEPRLAEETTMAEVEAALNLSDPLAALAALGRLDAIAPRRKDVEALVGRSIPAIAGRRVHTTAAAPLLEPSPAYGPIAFNNGGDVLVRTRDRVIRVDRASFDEAPVDAALAWPGALSWPSGDAPTWQLTAIEERCDAPTLLAHFKTGDGALDVPLPILTPARCTASPRVAADVLGAGAQGLLIAVRGDVAAIPLHDSPRPAAAESLALAPGAAVPLGAARSPDGAVIAVSTARGVLVASVKPTGRGMSGRLWTGPMADGGAACVPSNGGDRIACVLPAGVAIYDSK